MEPIGMRHGSNFRQRFGNLESGSDDTELLLGDRRHQHRVAWTEIGTSAGDSIYLLQYAGGSWTAVDGSDSNIGLSGSFTAGMPSAAYAGGTLYAAWDANTDGTTNIVAAGDGGSGWSPISIETPASAGVNQVSRGAASDPAIIQQLITRPGMAQEPPARHTG